MYSFCLVSSKAPGVAPHQRCYMDGHEHKTLEMDGDRLMELSVGYAGEGNCRPQGDEEWSFARIGMCFCTAVPRTASAQKGGPY